MRDPRADRQKSTYRQYQNDCCLLVCSERRQEGGTRKIEISFFVPGPPQGKARARTVRGFYGRSTTYTPAKTVVYEGAIRSAFRNAAKTQRGGDAAALVQPEPVIGKGVPVRIRIEAFFKPAARTTRKQYALIQAGKLFPIRKPDVDNIVKVVADALNGVAYKDDAQVIEFAACKAYSHEEGLAITVSTMTDGEDT